MQEGYQEVQDFLLYEGINFYRFLAYGIGKSDTIFSISSQVWDKNFLTIQDSHCARVLTP